MRFHIVIRPAKRYQVGTKYTIHAQKLSGISGYTKLTVYSIGAIKIPKIFPAIFDRFLSGQQPYWKCIR